MDKENKAKRKDLNFQGIQRIIFCYKNVLVMSYIDEIEKYAVYTSGVNYSPKALKNN